MSRAPSQPEKPAEGAEASASAADGAEILKTPASKRTKQIMKAGVAVGIGSAAIVAALLYANRSRRDK